MPQPKLIAALLRSIADLLEDEPKRSVGVDPAEPGGDYSVATFLGSPGNALMKEAAEMMKAEERKSLLKLDTTTSFTDKMDEEEAEYMATIARQVFGRKDCKTCLNGGKGRHRNDCPRGHSPVVDHSQEPKTEPGEEEESVDGYDEARKRIDEINAAAVIHPCCGSKGQRHKKTCVVPPPIAAEEEPRPAEPKSEWEEGEAEKPPAEPKSFDCDECGKTFQADPSDARCECGSNNIWPTGS